MLKYMISVFLGAASYGILSTFVVLAYGHGYTLGEVVGSQMMVGFLLTWGLAAILGRRKNKALNEGLGKSSGGRGAVKSKLTVKQKVILMVAGTPTAITGLLYYESLRYIPASVAILLLFQF